MGTRMGTRMGTMRIQSGRVTASPLNPPRLAEAACGSTSRLGHFLSSGDFLFFVAQRSVWAQGLPQTRGSPPPARRGGEGPDPIRSDPLPNRSPGGGQT
jgi:hypothetical protein